MNKKIPLDLDLSIKLEDDKAKGYCRCHGRDEIVPECTMSRSMHDFRKFIRALEQVPGALNYDGDASMQVLLPLNGGGYLRIGIADHDVAETPGAFFVDRYEGLPIVGATSLQTGKVFGAK